MDHFQKSKEIKSKFFNKRSSIEDFKIRFVFFIKLPLGVSDASKDRNII
jgi:hypothetical protein